MKNAIHYLFYSLLGIGIYFLGVSSGLIYKINNDPIEITPVATIEKEKTAILKITEVSPFGIKGEVQGNDLRIITSKDTLEIKANESFQVNTAELFRNIEAVTPENAQFFASKRGKTFYPVRDTKQLEKTRPENLVFFTSEKEAIGAGYKIND